MKWLEMARKGSFWFLDFMRGSPVRKHHRSIAISLNGQAPVGSTPQHEKALAALLHHAATTVPFYMNHQGFHGLGDFDVINKSIVRGSFPQFISSRFDESELIPVVTSGSTGTPFKVYQDLNKKRRNSADTIFFAQLAGYDLGDRLLYLKIFAKEKMKNPLSYWMENTIPIDVIHLDDEKINGLIQQMEKDGSSFSIIGYASALELICKYLDKSHHGCINAKVKSVIAISETLNEYTKRSVDGYFKSSIVSRYSNLENGILAQQEITGNGRYLVNTASYIIEILEIDRNEPAEPGKTGRIVVTDLFNFGMPLIRYDTGDLGILAADSTMPGRVYLEKVEGRRLDMLYDTKGKLVSSYMVYKNMWKYTDIIQYQLIQETATAYTIKINANLGFNKADEIIKEFQAYLGKDAIITPEFVSEIPLLSSGKRKMIVNNFVNGRDKA